MTIPKFLLSLLLVLVVNAPSCADVLVQRHRNSDVYKTGPNTYKLVMGGDVSNAYPFDIDGPMRPQTYKWSDVKHLGGNIYRLDRGEWGYTVNIGATTQGGLAGGEVRIHPVRKRWDVYYSIAPSTPTALSYRQVNDKTLELYVDTAQVRYSFFIGDLGFKINNRLKESYTGGDEWSYTYNVGLEGLTRSGRRLIHNGVAVSNLPDPFMVDANNTVAPVQEVLNGGTATLIATGISSLVLPIDIDPSVVVQPTNNMAQIIENIPNTNVSTGTQEFAHIFLTGSRVFHPTTFDFSAISMASIINATFEQYWSRNFIGDPAGFSVQYQKLFRTDWVYTETTWNIYKTGSSWTTPGGLNNGTDRDTSFSASATYTGSPPKWVSWDVTSHARDALANTGSILYLIESYSTGEVNKEAIFYTPYYTGDTSLRPKLTIEFEATIRTHLGYKDMVF